MVKHVLTAALLTGLLTACAVPAVTYAPVAPPGTSTQAIRVNPKTQVPYVISSAPHSLVVMYQINDDAFAQWRPTFDIDIVAKDAPVTGFNVSNIVATQAGRPVQVVDRTELQKRIEADSEQQENMMLMIGMLGAMSSGVAMAHPTAMSASTIGMNTMSISAAAMVTDQTVADNNALGNEVQRSHLATLNVMPGSTDGALVSLPDATAGPIAITITVGPDTHQVVFVPKS